MPSLFARLMAPADAVQTRVFGETILLSPWIKPGPGRGEMIPAGADPARPPRTVRGVFTLYPASDTLQGVRRGTELNGMTRMSVGVAELWIEPAVLASLPYAVGVGDRITLTDEAGTPSYEIVRAEPTDLAEGKFPLVVVKM
ncbi:hypothetical protein [Methylobacterium aquaticum]|uniref:Uncharacterized protein n=1 Tax=Methylobacterium aquaticum TaxID=270351 RepID=A0A0C6FXU0_9HYPH|nr:hypothetical protein [Methylobacterium aquaticum]BAQ50424.1 hypothetical protein Maq22A_4p60390 [Methylobacterium aquaticum]